MKACKTCEYLEVGKTYQEKKANKTVTCYKCVIKHKRISLKKNLAETCNYYTWSKKQC